MSDVRFKIVDAVLTREMTAREAAELFGVSKTQVYEWIARYRQDGLAGLEPRSRRPHRLRNPTPALVEDTIVELRRAHPRWGAKKIRAVLVRDRLVQDRPVPAVSTVHRVLVRHGLVPARRARGRVPEGGWQRFERSRPNELWHIDGTQHALADGTPFWVVDLIDDHSRFLLATEVGPALTTEAAWAALRIAVARYGLPAELLSDNGLSFTGRLHERTVSFERQVRAAGIRLIHARPFHPQTLGKLERQHAEQNNWLHDTGAPASLAAARAELERYRAHYNQVRPHEALDQQTPASRYRPGAPIQLPVNETGGPADASPPGALPRKVRSGGTISYANQDFPVGTQWAGVTVGLVREGARLRVFYGSSELATFLVGDLPHPSRGPGSIPHDRP